MASRPASRNTFGAEATLEVGDKSYRIYRLSAAGDVTRLPYSLKILLENLLRTEDGVNVTPEDIRALAGWDAHAEPDTEIRFSPARVLIHDSTGVPAMVELASMREAMVALGGDPGRINPQVPVELVVDHSVMADVFGRADALERNVEREYERNAERYGFLRWGQRVFDGLKVVPPGRGIVHQVNLEYLARVVMTRENDGAVDAYPDALVGADSHTPTVNGLGIVAWGVGGIEAGSAMLGQPISMLIPRVVGFKLTGELPEGTTATDLVLTITEQLRRHGVVGTFVEFYGPGVAAVPLANRATIGNMSPEYGSTISIFPIDEETLRYLRMTGRSDEQVALVEAYAKEQGLWHDPDVEIDYSARLELDLSTVVPSLAGPKRPQDRISLTDAKQTFRRVLAESVGAGTDLTERPSSPAQVTVGGTSFTIDHGSIVLAAITACTNTSNPSVMIGAALLAKKAVERGLTTQPWVKTILAPGSTIVMDYYDRAGLTPYLEKLGFYLAGFGCMSCIGNSGPLSDEVIAAIHGNDLSVASVLSGNRNFEGRINADVKMNFLASPPLVVAYALAGTIDLDIVNEPLGHGSDGSPVYLSDIWPSMSEIQAVIDSTIAGELFSRGYADVYVGDEKWMALPIPDSDVFEWDPASMHLRRPPYFDGMTAEPAPVTDINGARVLVKLGDSVTTDHISPAGAIHPDSLAGRYLLEHGVERKDLNTLLSRRGNHEVVKRGAFANVRLRNQLAPGTEGGFTRDFTKAGGPVTSIFDAAESYAQVGTPLVVIAGMEYGTGSSRDTAAKGPWMLGVKAVIAGSFERIHRSNLIGMGILPLQFLQGDSIESLGLTGEETFDIAGIDGLNGGSMPETVTVRAGGIEFRAKVRLDTPVEADYYRHGGIMPYVLRHLAKDSPQAGPAPVTS